MGGPHDGLEGFVYEPQEVLLVRSLDGFVEAYEFAEKRGAVRIYRHERCVGRLPGQTVQMEAKDAPGPQGEGGIL